MEAEASKPLGQDNRLRFETLLSDLSARFMRARPAQVDEEIESALRKVTEFFHAHRCGLLQVDGTRGVARLGHAWYAQGVRRVPAGQNCAEGYSWSFERLVVQKQAIAFNDLSELPPDAAADFPSYIAGGVCSTLMIPLFIGEDVRHIVVLQTMKGGGTLSPELLFRVFPLYGMHHADLQRDRCGDRGSQSLAGSAAGRAVCHRVLRRTDGEGAG